SPATWRAVLSASVDRPDHRRDRQLWPWGAVAAAGASRAPRTVWRAEQVLRFSGGAASRRRSLGAPQLQSGLFRDRRQAESTIFVEIDDLLAAHVQQQICLAVAVYIAQAQYDWGEILIGAEEVGTGDRVRFRWVATRQLDDDDLSVEVHRHQMGRVAGRLPMA